MTRTPRGNAYLGAALCLLSAVWLISCSGTEVSVGQPGTGLTATTRARVATPTTASASSLVVLETALNGDSGFETPQTDVTVLAENTGTTVAEGIEVTARYLDKSGGLVEERSLSIPIVVPPGRFAFLLGGPNRIGSVVIYLRPMKESTVNASTPNLRVADPRVTLVGSSSGPVAPGATIGATVDGSLTNAGSAKESVEIFAVLRDQSGALVGGVTQPSVDVAAGQSLPFTLRSNPIGRVPTGVEVYPAAETH